MRISGPVLAASLLLSSSLALSTASDAGAATERAGGRNYHTLTKVKKTKVQACLGPVRDTAVGPGLPIYVRLNNRGSNHGAFARVTTNLLDRDYNAAPHRSDSGFYAVVTPDEMFRVEYTAYNKTVKYEIVASAIGGC